ncbi:reverse transcriptase domain-containing protein, partial [Tanacetum coccineum]
DIPEPSNARGDLTPGLKAWRLYTDGASNNEGSGVGLILIAPDNVRDIYAFVDSKLVASQVEGSYEAKGGRMIKYREKVLVLAGAFNRFRITHIPRAENRKADALSKLAAVNIVVEDEGLTWMTPIQNYLEEGKLPEDPVDARTLMEKIGNYTIKDGVLYRKSYLVVAKAMNLGYFWPSTHRDARELIRACDDCQAHAVVPRLPKADMISVTFAWPFMKWGMDIVGLLQMDGGEAASYHYW